MGSGKGETSGEKSVYASVNSILNWDMINIVLRIWLQMVDSGGKQKKMLEWNMQEVSIKVLREIMTVLDLAFHYGNPGDREAADRLQKRLLHDDTKESGVLNKIATSMREFKKHDKKIAKQEHRETRQYAVDMVKTLHIVLRVYERLCKADFVVRDRKRYVQGHTKKRAKKGKAGKGPADGEEAGSGAERDVGAHDDGAGDAAEESDQEEGNAASKEEPDADESEDDGPRPMSVEMKLEFAAVLKIVSHHEIVKLYMFLLEQYSRLDAPTLHATASFFHRLCTQLQMEPIFYKLDYLQQLHTMLTDRRLRKSAPHREILVFATRITKRLMATLLPEDPVLPPAHPEQPRELEAPDPSAGPAIVDGVITNLDALLDDWGNVRAHDDAAAAAAAAADSSRAAAGSNADAAAEGSGEVSGEAAAGAFGEAAVALVGVGGAELSGLAPEDQVVTLKAVQDRVADVMFVELLFEKGTREIDMINAQYSWRAALGAGRDARGAAIGGGRGDGEGDAGVPGDDLWGEQGDEGGGVRARAVRARDPLGDEDDMDDLGIVQAAPPASAAQALGFTSEDKLLMQDLFEQVNGQRTCKELLLEDWNERSEKQLTAKSLTAVLASLSLKPKQLTSSQEARLAVLAEEYSSRGSRAPKIIASMLPGGFSVAAIKKLLEEHGISLAGTSKAGKAGKSKATGVEREELAGSDDEGAGPTARRKTSRSARAQLSDSDTSDVGAPELMSDTESAPAPPPKQAKGKLSKARAPSAKTSKRTSKKAASRPAAAAEEAAGDAGAGVAMLEQLVSVPDLAEALSAVVAQLRQSSMDQGLEVLTVGVSDVCTVLSDMLDSAQAALIAALETDADAAIVVAPSTPAEDELTALAEVATVLSILGLSPADSESQSELSVRADALTEDPCDHIPTLQALLRTAEAHCTRATLGGTPETSADSLPAAASPTVAAASPAAAPACPPQIRARSKPVRAAKLQRKPAAVLSDDEGDVLADDVAEAAAPMDTDDEDGRAATHVSAPSQRRGRPSRLLEDSDSDEDATPPPASHTSKPTLSPSATSPDSMLPPVATAAAEEDTQDAVQYTTAEAPASPVANSQTAPAPAGSQQQHLSLTLTETQDARLAAPAPAAPHGQHLSLTLTQTEIARLDAPLAGSAEGAAEQATAQQGSQLSLATTGTEDAAVARTDGPDDSDDMHARPASPALLSPGTAAPSRVVTCEEAPSALAASAAEPVASAEPVSAERVSAEQAPTPTAAATPVPAASARNSRATAGTLGASGTSAGSLRARRGTFCTAAQPATQPPAVCPSTATREPPASALRTPGSRPSQAPRAVRFSEELQEHTMSDRDVSDDEADPDPYLDVPSPALEPTSPPPVDALASNDAPPCAGLPAAQQEGAVESGWRAYRQTAGTDSTGVLDRSNALSPCADAGPLPVESDGIGAGAAEVPDAAPPSAAAEGLGADAAGSDAAGKVDAGAVPGPGDDDDGSEDDEAMLELRRKAERLAARQAARSGRRRRSLASLDIGADDVAPSPSAAPPASGAASASGSAAAPESAGAARAESSAPAAAQETPLLPASTGAGRASLELDLLTQPVLAPSVDADTAATADRAGEGNAQVPHTAALATKQLAGAERTAAPAAADTTPPVSTKRSRRSTSAGVNYAQLSGHNAPPSPAGAGTTPPAALPTSRAPALQPKRARRSHSDSAAQDAAAQPDDTPAGAASPHTPHGTATDHAAAAAPLSWSSHRKRTSRTRKQRSPEGAAAEQITPPASPRGSAADPKDHADAYPPASYASPAKRQRLDSGEAADAAPDTPASHCPVPGGDVSSPLPRFGALSPIYAALASADPAPVQRSSAKRRSESAAAAGDLTPPHKRSCSEAAQGRPPALSDQTPRSATRSPTLPRALSFTAAPPSALRTPLSAVPPDSEASGPVLTPPASSAPGSGVRRPRTKAEKLAAKAAARALAAEQNAPHAQEPSPSLINRAPAVPGELLISKGSAALASDKATGLQRIRKDSAGSSTPQAQSQDEDVGQGAGTPGPLSDSPALAVKGGSSMASQGRQLLSQDGARKRPRTKAEKLAARQQQALSAVVPDQA